MFHAGTDVLVCPGSGDAAQLLRRRAMMKSIFTRIFLVSIFLLIVVVGLAAPAMGQNPSTAPPGQSSNREAEETQTPIKGFNEYENFRGMVNSSGTFA